MFLVKVKTEGGRTKEYEYKTEKRARNAIQRRKESDPTIFCRLFEELSVTYEQTSLDIDELDF